MKGRKPKPTKLHLLEGGVKKTHARKDKRAGEPMPEPTIPKCPRHLDKVARAEWKRMTKELESLGLLTNLDRAIFASYCMAYSEWVNATLQVQRLGMVVKGFGGAPSVNPFYQIVNKANEKMVRSLIEIGMSPSSRSRIKVPEKPKKSAEEEFLSQHG